MAGPAWLCILMVNSIWIFFQGILISTPVLSRFLQTNSPNEWILSFFQIHSHCKESYTKKCPLGQCRVSILPPTAINNLDSDGFWEATKPPGTSPLLVFINSKSGDNQVNGFLLHMSGYSWSTLMVLYTNDGESLVQWIESGTSWKYERK